MGRPKGYSNVVSLTSDNSTEVCSIVSPLLMVYILLSPSDTFTLSNVKKNAKRFSYKTLINLLK